MITFTFRIITALLMVLLPYLAFASSAEKHHYKVAVDAEYAPYEFRDADGEVKGMLPDLLRNIGKLSGITFEFLPMAWPDAVQALERGDVDLLNMIRTPARAVKYEFSQPHSVIEQVLFRNVHHANILGLKTIGGKSIALQKFDIATEKLAARDDFDRVMVDSKQQGFVRLNSGEVAGFFAAEQPGLYFLHNHDLPSVEVATFGLWPQKFCFVAKKGRVALIGQLNRGLTRLKKSGAYARIAQHWLIKPPNWFGKHKVLIVSIAIVLLVAVLALWLWVFMLRRTVGKRTQSLKEQSARYRLLFDSNMDAIILLDDNGFIDCNTATLKMFACPSREAFIDKHPGEVSPPTQADGVESMVAANKHMAAAYQHGEEQFEWVHRTFDGRDFTASVSLTVVLIDGKSILQATARDISETVQAKRLITLRQHLLEIILQPEDDLSTVLEQMVKQVETAIPGLLCSVLLLDDSGHLHYGAAPSLADEYCQAIDGMAIGPKVGSCGTAAFQGQRVIVSDIATDPLCEGFTELAARYDLAACWSEPIFDEYAKVLGTFAMYYHQSRSPQSFELNIIQLAGEMASIAILRKRSEAERARAFAIIETSSDLIAMADAEGQMIYINSAGRTMLGIAADVDVTALKISDLHSPKETERLLSEVFPQVRKHGFHQSEAVFLHQNGEEIPTLAGSSMQMHDDGSPASYSVIAHDIRAERKQQQRMEHTQRLESLGVLAGGIAHDFNNILTAIMGNAAMAERKFATHPQEMPRYLANIVGSSEKAAELCKQMLAYSGKGKFVVKPINLSHMVEEITKLLEVSIAKSVVLRYRLVEPLPAVDADAAQMQQVIMNLVINASDAIGEQSGVISIDTGIMHADRHYLSESCLDEGIAEGRYIFLEVSDTGCGMDKATQQRIFEPFFTTKFTGRGLGMSAVLGIIRGHSGTLKLYSEQGRGTSFKMLLPISSQAAEPLDQRDDQAHDWQGCGTVLIVDDEESIRESAAMMLEDMGFETLTANDGIEGVAMYRQHQQKITAVLLDMTMPRMDGKGCFSEIRRINPEAKVILSSGYNEQEATSHFSGRGLAGFVQKPYFPETLMKVMQEML